MCRAWGGSGADPLLVVNEVEAGRAVAFTSDLAPHWAVPEELSIVGFDDLPVSGLLTPRLTTMRQPAHDLGHRAATALYELVEADGGEDSPASLGMLPAIVQLRESVAPPPGSSR